MLMDGHDAISVQQLAEWRKSDTAHVIVDVREAEELAICGMETALHIPMQQIPSRMAELPTDEPLVVICHHGMRSMHVVNFLRTAGRHNAVNLHGGIDAWARQIDTAMQRY
jgi:rhodanese-related sulfurtransferase